MIPSARGNAADDLLAAHPRQFTDFRYVYPVLSRRAGGISIGVNLNLDKRCNFDCVYCQVDRSEPGEPDFVDLDRLAAELDAAIELAVSGRLYEGPRFAAVPPPLRRLNDIAFSGDGEPTTFRNFDRVVALAADVRAKHALHDVKLVLITNATRFHRPRVQQALKILDANHGEVWAKLDAGTEAYYRAVARTVIPLQQVLDNLLLAARGRPIVIQTLLMRIAGQPPGAEEQEAYAGRLRDIVAGGGRIKLVQLHSIARPPAESSVTALTRKELEEIAALVRARTGLTVAVY